MVLRARNRGAIGALVAAVLEYRRESSRVSALRAARDWCTMSVERKLEGKKGDVAHLLLQSIVNDEALADMLGVCIVEAVVEGDAATAEDIAALVRDYAPEEALQSLEDGDLEDASLKVARKLRLREAAEEQARTYEDGETIGPGECELCERDGMLLTAHHLIPRETHKRFLKRGTYTEEELSRVTMICRPCHSAIHSAHSNDVLAKDLNTVEKLLQDDAIYKFARWASKQRITARADALNPKLKSRR